MKQAISPGSTIMVPLYIMSTCWVMCAAFLDEICAAGERIDFLILDATHFCLWKYWFALSPRWNYFSGSKRALVSYRKVIDRAYGRSPVDLFDRIVEQQKKCCTWRKSPNISGIHQRFCVNTGRNVSVCFYGTDNLGHLYYTTGPAPME